MRVEGVPVEVRAVTRRFGATLAVESVSFDVRPGEVLGLLGPNGAGKTTTMRIMTGYLSPDDGDVTIGGVELAADALGRKRLLGYVPESSALYGEMSVESYLRFWARLRKVPRAQRARAVERSIDQVNLASVAPSRIRTLSHGFRQRVAIAQALVHDPRVLVLDEPTTGLDPRQVSEVRKLIARLGSERTVVLSSHLLSEVQQLCKRVVVLDEGRVVAVDEVAALTAPKGRPRLEVKVLGDVEAAAKVVRAVKGVTRVEVAGPVLVVEGAITGLGPRVSQAVVGAGIGLVELRDLEASTLEDAYLRLVR
ncbi:MAG: ABC transporter ATP-binding protein [Acidimicrobiales bacterium]